MNRLLLSLIFLSLCAGFSSAAEQKLKVLVITGGHGFVTNSFFRVFQDNPEITFTNVIQAKSSSTAYDREDLLSYDCIVLYDMVQNISETQKAKFLSLFDKGVGLVVTHHALVSYQAWPEFERIVGGTYAEPQDKRGKVTPELGWEHDIDFEVQVIARDHPITAGVKDFAINDEIYWGFRLRPDSIPLITTTHPKSGKPLAWYRTEKHSRVVYLQLGHGPSAFENPNYRKLLAQSIRWAAKH
ncbi:MAG TPA: ThuA domain-containing protein [Candidatus Limnocylindria bacterium]|nr:ThuA domain-containing protein [Candidatus Limnocylindria bacterium]